MYSFSISIQSNSYYYILIIQVMCMQSYLKIDSKVLNKYL